MEGELPHTRVDIVLASAPTLDEIDTAVAGILAHVASQDSSQSPVFVSVSGKDLPLSIPHSEWGALYYDWGVNPRQPNDTHGSTIWLHESETDPPDASYDSAYTSSVRGVWNDVDVETLTEWADNGTPLPEPATP